MKTWQETDVARLRRQAERRRHLGRVGIYFTAILFALFAVFPFSWALISMFKQSTDLYVKENNPFWFNQAPTDGDFDDAWLTVEIVSPWRAAGVPRFIAAAEVSGNEFFNPVVPEELAARIRALG